MSKHTYKQAGVDIHEAAGFVDDIGPLVKATQKKRKLANAFGLFAAGYDLSKYKQPVIFTGCDGVGTKLELLLKHDLLENAGKDLVAMNVNDVLTTGADPVLFLDYIGVNKIVKRQLSRIIAGISEYLQDCDCILAGGETAEMPGAVMEGMVELSGFAIGAAEKKHVLNPAEVKKGDVLVGWPSAGFHANGFSLVRRVLEKEKIQFGSKDAASLLAPTLLYHKQCRALKKAGIKPAAMAHITGGGLIENLGRIFTRRGFGCHLQVPYWKNDMAQKILRHADPKDAWNTFNMGIGWVAILDAKHVRKALKIGKGAVVLGVMDKSGVVTCEALPE
ncbi:MAG TPA: phosphoribosylformylglycinamidine cyclo-ligase [Verrucomicrobiales bacterium]|nr:phosphoribosylformylglycinamidine cyclo-ligase [Verrucomicrobiales bacterium]HRJ07643.1 phosphoribosylformylglycinamidine cyclo-ligase [Prosthecobacter sp.]HRK13376.1 phosphoribosylformylglycinamidine cyclo-ligase [Prosthecobacter sp.]